MPTPIYLSNKRYPMTLQDYQKAALTTAIYPEEYRIIYPALGLAGEAGEVADKVKKVIRDNGGEFTADRRHDIAMELGDVLWYVAVMADRIGYPLEDIAKMNSEKLASRMQRGKLGGSGDDR